MNAYSELHKKLTKGILPEHEGFICIKSSMASPLLGLIAEIDEASYLTGIDC